MVEPIVMTLMKRNPSDDDADGFSSCDGDCWDGIEDADMMVSSILV